MASTVISSRELRVYPTAKIFVSSSSKEQELREMAERAIDQLIRPLLIELRLDLRLDAVLWENFTAQIVQYDHVNAAFVNHVADSDLVIVLVGDKLRPGTAEELEKALETRDVNVALIKVGTKTPVQLNGLLKRFDRSERLLYQQADADTPWVQIIQPILRMCFEHLATRSGVPYADEY